MPVFHVVMSKVNPGVTAEQIKVWADLGATMVGRIPGLVSVKTGAPLAVTAHRAKGYDLCVVAVLEKPEDVLPYGAHPAHKEIHKMREAICGETIAFDMEFS